MLTRLSMVIISCVSVHARSVASDSATPWTVSHQAPLSMGLSRQEYWRGWPFPSPGNLPDPGSEPVSPTSLTLAGRFFPSVPPGEPDYFIVYTNVESLCCTPEMNIMLHVNYTSI